MRDVMTHRGPDEEGVYLHRNVGFGFRRLSIIDVHYGHQPMCNEDGSVWIVFNGEIYNHNEIRKDLISKGHIFKTRTDTESIIHLYEEEGIEGFKRLNGMFGFALWDNKNERLVLARDRLGIKPLYYTQTKDSLIFASEIKSILENKKVKRELNVEGLSEYLMFRFLAGEKTLFKDIVNLLPGHILVFQGGNITIKKFWDLPPPWEVHDISESNAVNQLEELLSDSVRLRLMSDVPLGTFCSGGIDSSLTSAFASQLSNFSLNTFSVGFFESDYDESIYADMVSRRYATRHYRLKVDNYTFAESLSKLIWHNDEPLNYANSVQIYHISKLAKESVTVVLTGEGADELFGGYPRYLIAKIVRNSLWMPKFFREFIKVLSDFSSLRKVKKLGQFLPLSLEEVIVLNSCNTDWQSVSRILNADNDYRRIIESRLSLLGDYQISQHRPMEDLFRLELRTYLVSILNRQDKMSMAASLESRVPFLDHRLVEWALKIPAEHKLKGFETKSIVKQLGEKMLPAEVVYRKKSGFGVPVSTWLRDKKGLGRYLEVLAESRFRQRGYLNLPEVDKLIAEHLSEKADHGEMLWGLINLETWSRIFLDGDGI